MVSRGALGTPQGVQEDPKSSPGALGGPPDATTSISRQEVVASHLRPEGWRDFSGSRPLTLRGGAATHPTCTPPFSLSAGLYVLAPLETSSTDRTTLSRPLSVVLYVLVSLVTSAQNAARTELHLAGGAGCTSGTTSPYPTRTAPRPLGAGLYVLRFARTSQAKPARTELHLVAASLRPLGAPSLGEAALQAVVWHGCCPQERGGGGRERKRRQGPEVGYARTGGGGKTRERLTSWCPRPAVEGWALKEWPSAKNTRGRRIHER